MNQLKTIGTAMLKRHGFFSLERLMADTKIPRKYCRDVLALFSQEGIVKQIKKGKKEHIFGRSPSYAMIYTVIDRKKLTTRVAPKRKENTIQDRLWWVMRNKFRTDSSFNLHDLMVLAGTKKGMTRWFLKEMHRAGYIEPSRRAGPGVEWRLTKDFGPERPYLPPRPRRRRDQKATSPGLPK